jgi:all-trans-retinol 13,14-reductase
LMVVLSYLPLKGKLDYYEISTAVSTEWFSGYQHGELYGLDHTAGRLRQDWLGRRKTTPLMKKIYG